METDSQRLPDGIDPESSPYKLWPVEGMPYPRGGVEDRAIRRLLGRPEWRPPFWRRWRAAVVRAVARALRLGRSASA